MTPEYERPKYPLGKWSSSDEQPRMLKYSPKHKYGKPAGRREIVEKYMALGHYALERDFKGVIGYPGDYVLKCSLAALCLNRKHFAISIRAWRPRYNDLLGGWKPTRKSLRRRAVKEAVWDELLDFEDYK